MEKVWRKVNQGLSSKSKTNTITNLSTDTGNSGGFGDGQSISAINPVSGSLRISSSSTTGRRLATSGHPTIQVNPVPLSQHVTSTASSERRRRKRRKSRPRKNGESQSNRQQQTTDMVPPSGTMQPLENYQHEKTKNLPSRMNTMSMPPLPPLPNQIANTSAGSGDISLRQRAVAKLRLFNFHLNWDLHMTQCKPCGPRSSGNMFTRRLCRNRRREDNELYRSNSFKFERFERRDGNDNAVTLTKQISVCDDYSLPIDFVKKRPSSFDPCLADSIPDNWTVPSPSSEHVSFLDQPTIIPHPHHPQQQVKLIEGYSDPKDSRKLNRPHHRKTRKDKRTRYTSDSSAPKSSAEDDNLSNKFPELNSPDSISEDLVRPLQSHKSPKKLQTPDVSKRNPSPYYYSDLLKAKEDNKEIDHRPRDSTASEPPQSTSHLDPITYKKSVSLDVPEIEREVPVPKRYSVTEEGVRIIRCHSPSTTTSEDSDCSECQKRREWHAKALALVRETCNISGPGQTIESTIETNKSTQKDSSMPPHRLLGPAVCACTAPAIGEDVDEFFRPRSIFYVHQTGSHECEDCAVNEGGDKANTTDFTNDEMSSGRTRQIYETAFDCKIARSDDDLDEVDRVTSHSVMLQTNNGNLDEKKVEPERVKPSSSRLERKRMRSAKTHSNIESTQAVTALSQNLERVQIEESVDNMNNTNASTSSQTPIRRYTPSPPSTAPLPVKFPGKHDRDKFFMNSIRSAPNLPASNPSHLRIKDLRLPLHNVRHHQEIPTGSNGSIGDPSFNPPPRSGKSRPRSVVLESGRVIELRKSHHSSQRRGRDYSSTESMATSSSEGSMESLRSSTSEGNRSTTSSGSRQSTSLSSHSSDSGHNICLPIRAPIMLHSKLHILSPISDKSSQEPASESSEFNPNRHTSSQKVSPTDESHKITGTDSNRPIDDQKTTDIVSKQQKRKAFPNKTLLHLTDEIIGSDSGISLHSREDGRSTQSAFQKYALPKLNLASEKMEPSNSANNLPQDLRDLPFDMPKLRRRKLLLPQDNCTSGSATSVDLGDLPFDMPKLRRRLRMNQPQTTTLLVHSTESSGISQASSSFSVRDDQKPIGLDNTMFRQNLTLNLNEPKAANKFGSLDLKGATTRGLNLNISNLTFTTAADLIDASVALERQGWYHGAITRVEAENTLRPLPEGSFLVRNCESTKQDYSLSLKSAKGFMHMRIQRNDAGLYILGQFSRPFESVPEMIRHFCLNRLPVRGAEHMCLLDPVIAQLL